MHKIFAVFLFEFQLATSKHWFFLCFKMVRLPNSTNVTLPYPPGILPAQTTCLDSGMNSSLDRCCFGRNLGSSRWKVGGCSSVDG